MLPLLMQQRVTLDTNFESCTLAIPLGRDFVHSDADDARLSTGLEPHHIDTSSWQRICGYCKAASCPYQHRLLVSQVVCMFPHVDLKLGEDALHMQQS